MIEALQSKLDYRFKNAELLTEALTHRSDTAGKHRNYERLEFLGDRVLSLVIADMLLRQYPSDDQGALAKRHVALVRKETLAEVAQEIGLGLYITLSKGEDDAGGRENPGLLSDVCEALIAAMYYDGGLPAAENFIRTHWSGRMMQYSAPPRDAKTALQEWAQGRGLPLPQYNVRSRKGPDHAPVFEISVTIDGSASALGAGASKRAAEQEAAALLQKKLKEPGHE